jgi:hypothetical protein
VPAPASHLRAAFTADPRDLHRIGGDQLPVRELAAKLVINPIPLPGHIASLNPGMVESNTRRAQSSVSHLPAYSQKNERGLQPFLEQLIAEGRFSMKDSELVREILANLTGAEYGK